MGRFGLTRANAEAKLERWYGGDVVDSLKLCGGGLTVPIPIMGVPVMLGPGGRFLPHVGGGTGFASLSDLIAEATAGKRQEVTYTKTGPAAPAVASSQTLWPMGAMPVAGAAPAAPAGGTVPTRTSTGALAQQDPGGSDTLHMTTWVGLSSQTGSLMLYDYLFGTHPA